MSIWLDPPNDEDAIDQGQIFKCILKEWSVQVKNMREEAASEATEADKDVGEDDKDDNKQTKLKSKRSSRKTAGKQKSSSLKKVKLPDDNLHKFFTSSQDKNSQETADVTLRDFPKESEVTESKNKPKSLSHRNIHRSPLGSGGEGSPEPSSKSKGSPP